MDIEAILKGLEDPNLELKETMPERSDLAKTVSAFANGRGGRFLIGIQDKPRKVVGLTDEELFDFETRVAQMVRDRIEPLLAPRFVKLNHQEQSILEVRIHPGSETPYYLKAKGKYEGTYIRVGSTTQQADRATIQELDRRRINQSYDMTPLPLLGRRTIPDTKLGEYMGRRMKVRGQPPIDITPDNLVNLGLLVKIDDRYHPSIGGVLLFSEEPGVQFSHAKVRCARFRGTDMEETIDEKEMMGPLPDQIEAAFRFFKTYTARGAKVNGLYREERDAYPSGAVREALVNAVCHRDYNQAGSDIRFAIFDDRLEITSPGALPVGVTLENLGQGVSEARNRVIARVFRDLGLIEQWGQGITRIRNDMVEWGLPAPEFREIGLSFKVILRAQQAESATSRPSPAKAEPDEDQKKILAHLAVHDRITTKEATELIGHVRSHVNKIMKKLIESGEIRWVGKSKNDPTAHYIRLEK